MNPVFEKLWAAKVARVRGMQVTRQATRPPFVRQEASRATAPRADDVVVDSSWSILVPAEAAPPTTLETAFTDLAACARTCFGIPLPRSHRETKQIFRFNWDPSVDPDGFLMDASPERIIIKGASEVSLLRASLWLSNYWRMRGGPLVPRGKRVVRPRWATRLSADRPGGFSTTYGWVHGREKDSDFLELARVGVTAIPVMFHLQDHLRPQDVRGPFKSLASPGAAQRRDRLARLVRRAASFGVSIFLMGYNPRLPDDAPVFRARPQCRGAAQFGGKFRVMCWNDPDTANFLADAWGGLVRDIPQLGGIEAIVGGEGFYHCYMRSRDRNDCPRCSKCDAARSVADLLNRVGAAVHKANPNARVIAWPYSADWAWSNDIDQRNMVERLDPATVSLIAEIDKDQIVHKPAGWAKHIWDYSLDDIPVPPKTLRQRAMARRRGIDFGVKLETNVAWEVTGLPYLPVLDTQAKRWRDTIALRPAFVQNQWLSGVSWGAPPEELGFWAAWGKGTEFEDPHDALRAIARREFGDAAAPLVLREWKMFSDALTHHVGLHYYQGSNFIGSGSPLPLDPNDLSKLDRAFFGVFYWHLEHELTDKAESLIKLAPLFHTKPAYEAVILEGSNAGKDVAVQEFRTLARKWSAGVRLLERAMRDARGGHAQRLRAHLDLGEHLRLVFESAGNVEEWLRLRDRLKLNSRSATQRHGLLAVNRRMLARMETLARAELAVAQADLPIVSRNPTWDLRLRMDMDAASLADITRAKIRHVKEMLDGGEWQRFKDRVISS